MGTKNFLSFFLPIVKKNKPIGLTVIWIAVIGDIIFGQIQSDLIFFGILGLYFIAISIYKLNSKATFLFCFFILGLLFIEFLFTGPSPSAEKASVWLFLFMATGILQEIFFNKR